LIINVSEDILISHAQLQYAIQLASQQINDYSGEQQAKYEYVVTSKKVQNFLSRPEVTLNMFHLFLSDLFIL